MPNASCGWRAAGPQAWLLCAEGSGDGASQELDERMRCRDTSCRSSATKLSPSRRTSITGQADTPHRDVAAFFQDRF